jgi:hypothetical protein
MHRAAILAVALAALAAPPASAQLTPAADWAAHAANQYQIAANVTYLTANNYESKLDVYSRRGATAPAAVEDCLCALRYLAAQAKTYDIDVNRLVVTGESAAISR